MKIYEIGTGYTPIPAQVAAATESIVEELTKAFIKKNVDVEIVDICSCNRKPNNLPISEVNVPSVFVKSDVSLGLLHKLKRVVYSVALSQKLKKILKSANEKVALHFHNQYNLFFFLKLVPKSVRKKAFVLYTNHNGFWNLDWDVAKSTLQKRYFQEIYAMKNSDLVFALNEKTKNNIIQFLGVPEERVIRIDNGVNTEIYSPIAEAEIEKVKQTYGLNGKKVILQVGSVYENKGQERTVKLLADSLKKDENLVFAYAGGIVSQEYFDRICETTKSLGVEKQVRYLGEVSPGEEMNKLYNMAQTTVFGSVYESFGLVCVESLAAGVPVVLYSDALLNFGVGCIVSSKEDFAKDIQNKILAQDQNYYSLKDSCRENAVMNFTWDKIADDYLKVVSEKM